MARPSKPWFHKARNRWCCTIRGKVHVLARGQDAKREATDEFHRLMAAHGQIDATSSERITFAELAERFLESVAVKVERGERAAVTYDGYVKYLSSASERLGPRRLADLTPYHVAGWIDAPGLGWGPTTRANAITALKAMTRWARRARLIRIDPLADLEKPTRKRREAVLTDDQVRAVLTATEGTPFADLVFALWESGCRPIEVTTLTAEGVDLEKGVWLVRNKTRTKTGHATRPVFLTPALVELSRRLVERYPTGLLFRNARGAAWTRNAQACAWRRLRESLGYGPEATSYAIRHRYAREALRRGLDSSEVAALMGHSDAKMVDQVYGGWEQQDERLKDAAKRVRPGETPPGPETPPDEPPTTPASPSA